MGVLTCARPMPPELIVLHELGVLPIPRLPIGAACHISIEHPAVDGEAPFGEVLPGMALGDRGPLDRQRSETGLQRDTHRPMITDDRLRRPPLGNGLPEDLDQRRDMLPIDAAGSHDRSAVAVEDEHAVEPAPVDLDQLPEVGTPDLMGRRGLFGTCVWGERALRARGSERRLFVEGDHLPDGRMAIPVAQGAQRHLHAVMT